MSIIIQASQHPTTHQPISSIGRCLASFSLKNQQSELLLLTTALHASEQFIQQEFQAYQALCTLYCNTPQQIARNNSFSWIQHNLTHQSRIVASAINPTSPKSIQHYFEIAYQQLLFKTYHRINRQLHDDIHPKLVTLRDNISYLQKALEQSEQEKTLPQIMYAPKPPTSHQHAQPNPEKKL